MLGGINYASSQISNIYNLGSQQLADTLTRIASGKKFQNASEDLVGFLRSQRLDTDISGYERVRENLTLGKMYTSTAVSTGSSIYENLSRMKELATQYAATSDTDLQAQYSAEFDALKEQVSTAIDETYVEGVPIADTVDNGWDGDIDDIDLDPDGSGSLTMTISDNTTRAEVDALTAAGGAAAVQTEMDSVLTFLEEAKGLDAIIDQQLNINETIINSKQAVKSLITDIDEAEEMSNALDLQIRQQAAVSMLAQANLSREAVLKLYM